MGKQNLQHDRPEICLFLPSLDGGGAERVFVHLANQFVALGLSVDFALAAARGPFLPELSEPVRIVDFAASGVMKAVPALARYLRNVRPEVILAGLDHANIAMLLAWRLARRRSRCVISMRNVPTAVYRENKSMRGLILLTLMKNMYRFADAIIANSGGVATDVSRFPGVSRRDVNVIYNPVDIKAIQSMSAEPVSDPWSESGAPPIVLGVGRLDVLKDFRTLIRAFAKLRAKRECHLLILGEGRERTKLENLIVELELQQQVRMPGFTRNPFAWMRLSGVYVNSSLTEGCPNALLQALSCGTPVVSTDSVGGSAEILEDGKWGRLVPVGDTDAMAAAIETTLDASTRPDVRQRANDFAQYQIVQQYLQVLLPDSRLAAAVGQR